LIGIGKPWGHANPEVPSEAAALALLERAFDIGVRYFDTAPSYGVSEERVGLFLRSLTPAERSELTVATKFGEHWDSVAQSPFVDHSYDALRRSLDGSVERLGRIDALQLHKTTPDVLGSADLGRAWDYARSLGIETLGASVSDLESAGLVIHDGRYRLMQLPFNPGSLMFEPALLEATAAGVKIAVNRPFGMGRLLYESGASKEELFRFVLTRRFRGVVLGGTKSVQHLEENWSAFGRACGAVSMESPGGGHGGPTATGFDCG
jgi:aryl-alcohol dehydrogenase-like predicted oxidoreductase